MYSSRTRRMMLAIAIKKNNESMIVEENMKMNENGLGTSMISNEIVNDNDVSDGTIMSNRNGEVDRPVNGKNIVILLFLK